MTTTPKGTLRSLTVDRKWEEVFRSRAKTALETLLAPYMRERRWFVGKARVLRSTKIMNTIPIPTKASVAHLALVLVTYAEGKAETYLLPLGFACGELATRLEESAAAVAHLRIKSTNEEGVLCDATWDNTFRTGLLKVLASSRRIIGPFGEITVSPTRAVRGKLLSAARTLEPSLLKGEQSNTSIMYGDQFILKLYRRLEPGINPDLEMGRFLTERKFPNIAPVTSALEYRRGKGHPITLVILQRFVPNQGDAWSYTLDRLSHYYEGVRMRRGAPGPDLLPRTPFLDLIDKAIPPLAQESIGSYLDKARLLGQRTGELHVTLSRDSVDPNFAPEPFTDFYRRGLYQSMIGMVTHNFILLRQRLKHVPEALQEKARLVLDLEPKVRKRFQAIRDRRITAMRIRCHGDYHLGQVLFTGNDFIIIDFEGEPARPLSVRRRKGSPIRDVAGMLRSFHYAAYAALLGQAAGVRPEDFTRLEPWARFWTTWVSSTYLTAYLQATAETAFIPENREELQVLLDGYLLEKAIYELGYELNSRPDWVRVPLEGILQLVG